MNLLKHLPVGILSYCDANSYHSYQDQVSNVMGLPTLPGLKQLRQQLLPFYTRLRARVEDATHRPIHTVDDVSEICMTYKIRHTQAKSH